MSKCGFQSIIIVLLMAHSAFCSRTELHGDDVTIVPGFSPFKMLSPADFMEPATISTSSVCVFKLSGLHITK